MKKENKAKALKPKTRQFLKPEKSIKLQEKKKVVIPNREHDHVFSHALHRRLSNGIAKLLYHTPMTPNMASWIGFIFCMIAAVMFAFGDYKWLVIGAFVLEL